MGYPREAIIFETTNHSVFPPGTLVEAVGYGKAERGDRDDDRPHRIFIRAMAVEPEKLTAGNDATMWWYFAAKDLHPLTARARRWYRALQIDERQGA